MEDIIGEQRKYVVPDGLEKDYQKICQKSKRIWIQSEAKSLKLRIVVGFHCRERRYRAYDATIDIIKQKYCLKEMAQEVREFIQLCIH